MKVPSEEAQAKLPPFVDHAAAGEDVFISISGKHPSIELVALTPQNPRLTRHPDLAGSTQVLDSDALTKPLPSEEWGGLADS